MREERDGKRGKGREPGVVLRRGAGGTGRLRKAIVLPAVLAVVLQGCGGPPPPPKYPGHPEDLILYTIQPGETLYDLAERHYGERSLAWSLAIVNELPNPGEVDTAASVFIPLDRKILISIARQRQAAKRPYNRGTYLLELGRDREAIQQLEQALAVAPEVVVPRYHLALAYLRDGRIPEAVAELEEVAVRRPLDRDFRYALGYAYLKQGSFKEARREFEQAARFDSEFAPARFGVALAFQMAGKKKEAVRAWRVYLEMNPEEEWADRANGYLMDLYDGD